MEMNLKPIWEASYRIYREMDAICQRHGLRLFAAYGTELGAMRHSGPIPWDDDFDTAMPREDFEKFLEVAPRELPKWLKVVSYRNFKGYTNLFPKVVICDAEMLDDICKQSGLPAPEGVFVDIFPIDGYPSSRFWQICRYLCVSACRMFLGKTKWPIWNRIMEILCSRVPYETAKRVAVWEGWSKVERDFLNRTRTWMTANDFGQGKLVKFGAYEIRVPINAETELTWLYDNWRRLPPPELQTPDHTTTRQPLRKWRLG